jgi:two-component system, LytTR family, response regulator AlgR
MADPAEASPLATLVVDDEPLALERMEHICAGLPRIKVVGTARDGAAALAAIEQLQPELILLDMTMPELDGLAVARALTRRDAAPAVIFVTAHDNFAVEAFDLDAVDYVLKPVTPERLERAISRAVARRSTRARGEGTWLSEFWVPYRSELLRIAAADVDRIDAERDYVRLHVGARSYRIKGLRHDGLGVWSAELDDGSQVRIGRTYLSRAKAMAGR